MNFRTCFSFVLATATVAAVMALAGTRAAAQANGYAVTDLGLISGATANRAQAINDTGLVVGTTTITASRTTTSYKGWLWTPSAPNTPSGSLRTLDPSAGRNRSGAYDVNNTGLIVGTSIDSTAGTRRVATFWEGPNYSPMTFNALPRDSSLNGWWFYAASYVSDPNAAGEVYVAGRALYEVPNEPTFDGGIVWRIDASGTIVSVTRLSGYDGYEEYGEMNNRGQVIDALQTQLGTNTYRFDAFLWDGLTGTGTNLGGLGGTASFGNGINDYGTVVGESNTTAGPSRGFIWTPDSSNGTTGTMTALGTLGGTYSYANGINSFNQIVGRAYLKGDRTIHACLWQNGTITPTDLNSLKTAGATGLELLEAYRINNKGGIIGRHTTSKGNRAFLLTPK